MSKQTTDSHNASKPCPDCLRAYRQCDILIIGSFLLSAVWMTWVIVGLSELG